MAMNQRERMGRTIVSYEQNRPFHVERVSDGTHEIAGVNERYHRTRYAKLRSMLGNDEAIEKEVADYYMDYSDCAAKWVTDPATEFFLRDCVVNRGATGAAKILAMAREPSLINLLKAREAYERTLPRHSMDKRLRGEGWSKWNGMKNRWTKAYVDAKTFNDGGAGA